jgi:hypothetical protein
MMTACGAQNGARTGGLYENDKENAMVFTLYKIAGERTQTVIRSHDPRFIYRLADVLDGNPTDDVIVEQMKAFARDLRDVLDGKVAGHIRELSVD